MQKTTILLLISVSVFFTASCGSDKKNEITDSDMNSNSDEDAEAMMDNDTTEPDENIENDDFAEPDEIVEPDESVESDEVDSDPDEITEFEDDEGLENEDDLEIDDADLDTDGEDINLCGTEDAVCNTGESKSCTEINSYVFSAGTATCLDNCSGYDLTSCEYSQDQMDSGWGHTCKITDGKLFCWGSNYSGQLGDGTNINRSVPTRIGTFDDWDFISCGYSNTCGIRNGELY
ncbi:MAG TPA: hypothetical protein VLJ60_08935, partial [bacterium]|nr:hypothetical protein [bacterium]